MEDTMITRRDYLNAPRDDKSDGFTIHRQYYSQFVNDQIRQAVENTFGIEALVIGYHKCEHFNSIHLSHWDALITSQKDLADIDLLKKAGDGWSLSSGTCIFKEAGRQLVESVLN
jgi:hypothetical protein